MATADSVKAKIQNLIKKANTKTGRTDTTLNSAVDVLINGYLPNGIVPIPEKITETHIITISADMGNGTNTEKAILTGNSFIASHYADEGFSATVIPLTPADGATGVTHYIYHGNRNIGASNVARYGVALYNTSATALGLMQATAKLNGSGYNVSLRAKSTGALNLYVASSRTVKAGTYLVVLTYIE